MATFVPARHVLAAAVAFVAGCGTGGADADPNGLWNLTEIVEDDGSVHAGPTTAEVTYTIDTKSRTIVNRWTTPGEPSPYETTTFTYDVTPEGRWHIADAGPEGRTIDFEVACTSSTLTLTRVAHTGPGQELPPAPAYVPGDSPPVSPGTAAPPKKFVLTR